MISTLRIIGDARAQIDPDNLFTRVALSYLEIIAGARYSVQVGDMGDEETYAQMRTAEREYVRARPQIMLSPDAPTHVARLAWQHARRLSAPNPRAVFCASRTTDSLERLLEHHQPRLWLFGHQPRDWRHKESGTEWHLGIAKQ
jgi:hypothetical protein